MFSTIENFAGVDLKSESSEAQSAPSMSLRRAEGALLYPVGALSRTPTYERLWGLKNLREYILMLGLQAADKGVCILLRNEGYMFLVFYDVIHQQSLGCLYAGPDPDNPPVGSPTLVLANPSMEVLWKGLAMQRRWSGIRSGTVVIMGNGYDANLVLETSAPVTIRPQNDQIRPLVPLVGMVDPQENVHQDATLQAGNVLFTALEAEFQPVDDAPYRRDYGNNVQVSVVQSGYAVFSSELSGTGTLIDPFVYTVLCPLTLPTEDQLCNFINRDPNSQGVVSAQVVGTAGVVTLFPAAPLTGGTSQFAVEDVFAGPFAAACLTYCKKGVQPNTFSETMPSPVKTCQLSEGGRLSITIDQDTSDYAAQYDTIRIYVADVADKAFGLSANYYGSFCFSLEVPNTPGTYVIAPSMLDKTTVLSTEARTAPPCSMFVFDEGRLIMSGNADFPMRVWFTKQATRNQLLPEGIGIFNYIDFPATVVGDAIVALGSYRGSSVAYSKHSAYPYDATNGTTKRYAITTGALNSRTVKTWTNGAQYYLGRDYNIYTLTQPVTDARSDVPDFNLPAPQIGNYLQQYCDVRDTSFAHSVVDTLNKNWWIWLKNKAGGISGFTYQFETAQLTGPFDYPQLMCAEFLEDGDTRMVGMDMAGNLLFMDVQTLTTVGEPFDNDQAITLREPDDLSDDTLDGFGIAMINVGGPTKYVRRANVIRLQSPWLNCSNAAGMKSFYSVAWQCIQGSSGLVWVTAFNEKGQSVTRYYGDVFGRDKPPRVLLRMQGNLIQLLMTVVVGDDLPFALRNVTLEYEPMGNL